jgi:hypothetical protein
MGRRRACSLRVITHQAGTSAIHPQVAHENGANPATRSKPERTQSAQRKRSTTLQIAKSPARRQWLNACINQNLSGLLR